ncbi:MAG: preprotein translocase subunit SecY, partial [Deltaproteobacteria bacterium]|nr:preprotein translocase subunit SecY [Deltaproteobacteria bacterium]
LSFPYLENLKKEGELGRKKITQYTRYGTVLISMVQGFVISYGLESMHAPNGGSIVVNPGFSFRILSTITLTSGTVFLMWLGEEITERGVGNGISLIIYAGIVARIPAAIMNTITLVKSGEMSAFTLIFLIVLMIAVVAFIIFVELGQRKIPVQYAQRIVGRRVYGGQETHLPLKVNSAGVIPPIFASSLLMIPATITSMSHISWLSFLKTYLFPGSLMYNSFYAVLIIFFTFFYTAVTFNPVDVADNLKKYGGYVPGIRPGKSTSDYIDKILTRITVGGALYLTLVCVLPTVLTSRFNVPFYFGGTSLLIVIGVALDTISQVEAQLVMRNYDGITKNVKMKGRRW